MGEEQAIRFKADFERNWGPSPPFAESAFRAATVVAREASKFLLVYLHSPLHQVELPPLLWSEIDDFTHG
jgi:hypothetical protein